MRRSPILIALAVTAATGCSSASAPPPETPKVSGEQVYKARCASCRDQVGARIPTRDALAKLSPSRVLKTLDFGAMMSIAYPLKREEREAVAAFVGKGAEAAAASAPACPADRPILGTPGTP